MFEVYCTRVLKLTNPVDVFPLPTPGIIGPEAASEKNRVAVALVLVATTDDDDDDDDDDALLARSSVMRVERRRSDAIVCCVFVLVAVRCLSEGLDCWLN